MDTRMLDVAIGLALVFATLSLLVTAIQEAQTAIRNKRGRNLVRLVCSLVGDNRELSEHILAHPFLTSMAMEKPNGTQRSPSYLSSDVFVTGLLGYLTNTYTSGIRPASPQELVVRLKQKMVAKEQEFALSLESLLPGAELDWSAFEKRLQAWYDAVGERSSGWFKREVQVQLFVIGFAMAIMLNINPIVIAKALWHDAALRKTAVAQAELALRAFQTQTGAAVPVPGGVVPAAGPAAFQSRALENHLTTLHVALEGLKAPYPEEFLNGNASKISDVRNDAVSLRKLLTQERTSLGNDPKQLEARDRAAATLDLNLAKLHHVARLSEDAAVICATGKEFSATLCPLFKPLRAAVEGAQQSLKEERTARDSRTGDATSVALLKQKCKEIKEDGDRALCEHFRDLGILGEAGLPMGWTVDTWPAVFPSCADGDAACNKTRVARLNSVADLGNWAIAIAGWLITAMCVTLGAPFWFDMLGKLIKLRSSGVAPSDSTAAAPAKGGPASTLDAGKAGGASALAAAGAASIDAINDTERGLTDDDITRIQRALEMEATRQSGRLDLSTREAISAWQKKHGAAVTGELTAAQVFALLHKPANMEDDGYVG